MRLLFVHQNFPAQYRHIAAEAAKKVGWEVVALAMRANTPIDGVKVVLHQPPDMPRSNADPLASEFESKVIRGRSAAHAALGLRNSGFYPDVICGHPGWGETLFLKDVWPNASLISYFEFYYQSVGSDFGFDPEFLDGNLESKAKIRAKNAASLLCLSAADRIISPTFWQAKQLPSEYSSRLNVVHDGIDTQFLKPSTDSFIELKRDNLRIRAGDEIITFVSRNLEPYRGYHSFMRALPAILSERKNARVVVVGGSSVSYGRLPSSGRSYRNIYLEEVRHRLDMDRVHFVGNLPYHHYVRLLQISACHIYLTYPFVLSWSMLEALSIGCIVVASDTPPVTEFIKNGLNGLLVDFFDYEQLATRVIDVLAQPKSFSDLRENARVSALAYDSTTVCIPAHLNLIHNL